MISNEKIDHGTAFDWGRASGDYARYRDIYPGVFYEKIIGMGLCLKGQTVLDLGTGTGVLPRNLYRYGARFIGSDISEEQIAQARALTAQAGMDIEYIVSPAEALRFPADTFDAVTACQCFFYFDTRALLPNLKMMLKNGGKLAILFLAWLPGESGIALASERLVLQYSPNWTGAGFQRKLFDIPEWAGESSFEVLRNIGFDVAIPFTKETWNGRMKACRGVGASLPPEQVERFEREHLAMLDQMTPGAFDIPHYATMLVLENRK